MEVSSGSLQGSSRPAGFARLNKLVTCHGIVLRKGMEDDPNQDE